MLTLSILRAARATGEVLAALDHLTSVGYALERAAAACVPYKCRTIIQWTCRNLDAVRTICPKAYTFDSGWTLALPIPAERRIVGLRDHLWANKGDFVVCFKGLNSLCVPISPKQLLSRGCFPSVEKELPA